jgi:UDP-sulfoquinovose synthase
MKSSENAFKTQYHNVLGTLNLLWLMREYCPEAHLLKLGTMGEYGTPDCEIPEGMIPDGPMKGLPFPRSAGSFYHLSKVHDTHNIIFACKTWGLRSTDIMQGVVFGHLLGTRFDYDQCFGTVINRFCVQAAIEMPLTVYGGGGQTRGYLTLKDSIKCLTLALENPPDHGEYRTFNQFAYTFSVNELADFVKTEAEIQGLECGIEHIDNPRKEAEKHAYRPIHNNLTMLGYKPSWNISDELEELFDAILPYRDRIRKEIIMPTIRWAL